MMKTKTIEEIRNLPKHTPAESERTTRECNYAHTPTLAGAFGRHEFLPTELPVNRTLVVAPLPSLWRDIRCAAIAIPGGQPSRRFFETGDRAGTVSAKAITEDFVQQNILRRNAMKRGNHQFHDSESDDIYDLYNVCMENGLLDLRRLDEISDDERELFDIERLKEFGAHVISGCITCQTVINTLNFAREELKQSRLKRERLEENYATSRRDDSIFKDQD